MDYRLGPLSTPTRVFCYGSYVAQQLESYSQQDIRGEVKALPLSKGNSGGGSTSPHIPISVPTHIIAYTEFINRYPYTYYPIFILYP